MPRQLLLWSWSRYCIDAEGGGGGDGRMRKKEKVGDGEEEEDGEEGFVTVERGEREEENPFQGD